MKQISPTFYISLLAVFVASCYSVPASNATAIATPSFFIPLTATVTPSAVPTATPSPTNIPTTTPEPAISPDCRLIDGEGKLYIVSDAEFRDLWSHKREIDRVLAANYPEWAEYRQAVSWDSEPVTLGEVMNSASIDNYLNLQINSTVTLVTLGTSLNWKLPVNSDLFLISREISLDLNSLAAEWERPGSEQLHSRFPFVSNAASYALYTFHDYDHGKLKEWCTTYQELFGTTP